MKTLWLILNCAILDYYAASSGNNTEERSSQLLCGGSLKSRTMNVSRPVTRSYSGRLEYLVPQVQNGHHPYCHILGQCKELTLSLFVVTALC